MFQMIADVVLLCVYLYNIYTYIYICTYFTFLYTIWHLCAHMLTTTYGVQLRRYRVASFECIMSYNVSIYRNCGVANKERQREIIVI